MLFECAGEGMASCAIGHEIKRIRLRRIESRLKSGATGVRNWSWWQSMVDIGIIDMAIR